MPARRPALVVAVIVAATSACGHDRALAVIGEDPILDPPPGATELMRSETAGTAIGFGTPARVEVVWGVTDADEAVEWYLRERGEAYGLVRQGNEERWHGGRDGVLAVTVSISVVPGVADLDEGTLIGGPLEDLSWDGPVAVARVSSTDE